MAAEKQEIHLYTLRVLLTADTQVKEVLLVFDEDIGKQWQYGEFRT